MCEIDWRSMMIKLRQTGREKERERDKEREKERDKEI